MMEKTLAEKQLEILEDTVKYYSEDTNRRCMHVDTETCYYAPESLGKQEISNGCAVGRLLSPELRKQIDEYGPISIDTVMRDEDIELPLEVRELTADFLMKLQDLHDKQLHWNKEGLTQEGLDKVQEIKDFITNNS